MIKLSLLYHYFHGNHSEELFSLLPLVQTFTASTYHATSTEYNHPHFLCIPILRRKSTQNSFFPRTATFLNRLLCECFLKHYHLNLLESKVNCFISFLSSLVTTSSYIHISFTHSVTLFLKWLSGLRFGEL